jgi:hypothetical protein
VAEPSPEPRVPRPENSPPQMLKNHAMNIR